MTEPVELPKQDTLSWFVMDAASTRGWVMVTLAAAVQPLLSVTVTVQLPAARLRAVAVVWTGTVFQA